MFKYIKWELLDEFRKKKLLLGCVAIIYILVLILSRESTLIRYLILPMIIILLGSLSLAFSSGAKKTMDSYQNKTFLLESMIPLSPNKILLAKYILAIILNIIYSIVFIIGLAIILKKADINLIKEILDALYSLDFDEWLILIRFFVLLISASIAATSLTTLVFLALKSVFPNGKGLKTISYIVTVVLVTFISGTFLADLFRSMAQSEYYDIYFSILLLGAATAGYFGSLYFVKNKLEIYN